MFYIRPSQAGYKTARKLSLNLDAKLSKSFTTRIQAVPGDLVINWGNSTKLVSNARILNDPTNPAFLLGKIKTLNLLKNAGFQVPEVTPDRQEAMKMQNRSNCAILGRDLEFGRGGKGITFYKTNEEIGYHRFYTQYIPKAKEFRIHYIHSADLDFFFAQEKLRRRGVEPKSKYVRSHDNGYVFAFKHLVEKPVDTEIFKIAKKAVLALGLDFGVCDIGWHPDHGVTLYEVNTAPGLEGTAFQFYVNTFNGMCGRINPL